MNESFRIEALSARHDRTSFNCGVPALDWYLRELAMQDVRRRVSNCFIALDEASVVAGYYTFAAASLPLAELPGEMMKRLPRYALLPAGLIGRLAVDDKFQRRRLGGALIMDAAARAAGSDPAIFALIVDAKDEAAVAFYRHLDFTRFASKPLSLFLPLSVALDALNART